jgi:hypothetical protein
LFVFTKKKSPRLKIPNVTICSANGEGDGVEVDVMENDTNIIENEGIYRVTHKTFAYMDDFTLLDEIYDDIHNLSLIDKVHKPLYKESKTSVLFFILMLVHLKILYDISNTCMTQILRYVRWFFI